MRKRLKLLGFPIFPIKLINSTDYFFKYFSLNMIFSAVSIIKILRIFLALHFNPGTSYSFNYFIRVCACYRQNKLFDQIRIINRKILRYHNHFGIWPKTSAFEIPRAVIASAWSFAHFPCRISLLHINFSAENIHGKFLGIYPIHH